MFDGAMIFLAMFVLSLLHPGVLLRGPDKIETDLPGVDSRRHVFRVENFGTISLAEVFAEPGTRTLTMMHLQLGSPHVADLTAAETRTNGQPPPPPLSPPPTN